VTAQEITNNMVCTEMRESDKKKKGNAMDNEYKTKIGTLVDRISESYKKECYIAPHDFGFLPN
jgi:hypothetical protein